MKILRIYIFHRKTRKTKKNFHILKLCKVLQLFFFLETVIKRRPFHSGERKFNYQRNFQRTKLLCVENAEKKMQFAKNLKNFFLSHFMISLSFLSRLHSVFFLILEILLMNEGLISADLLQLFSLLRFTCLISNDLQSLSTVNTVET